MTTSVGVVGLGLMGGSMARRLIDRGFDVYGYDVDIEAVERAAADGVRPASSLREVCLAAETVVTSLPNSSIVRAAWLGADGIASHARAGTCLVEASTIDPDTMREVATEVPAGVAVLDAPVSGGPAEARSGTLTFIVGGGQDDLDRARGVLDALSTQVHHAGALGAGKVVKLVNNVMSTGNILVAAEAFCLGEAAGMDPSRLFEILSASGGVSAQFVKRFPKALVGDYAPGFSMELGAKDLALAMDLAHTKGVPAPVTASAREMYGLAVGLGHGTDDMVAFVKLYRELTAGSRSTATEPLG